ncbi:hypothetical protein KAV79_05020, partial [Candidatus Aerophobetes bacterium]|nr:hypothetical protein [Candidatus Aerophobetes bacterium]
LSSFYFLRHLETLLFQLTIPPFFDDFVKSNYFYYIVKQEKLSRVQNVYIEIGLSKLIGWCLE